MIFCLQIFQANVWIDLKQICHETSQISLIILLPMLQRNRLDSRSLYRSVRYRISRDQQTRTADPSSCYFRIKKNSCMEVTMAQTIDSGFGSRLDAEDVKQYMRKDYLQSFNSLMEGTSRIRLRQASVKERVKDISMTDEARILLPEFQKNQKQVEQSEHSLLTPFVKPYSHVKLMISNCQNQLKAQKNTCQQIRCGLRHVKQTKLKQLAEIERIGRDSFASIRSILRKNQINQQQKKLKTKRELQQIESDHNKNRELFQTVDQKSTNLQLTIFNSTPFNVKIRGDQNGQLYI